MVREVPFYLNPAFSSHMNTPTSAPTALFHPYESIGAHSAESLIAKPLQRAEQRIYEAGDKCRAAVRQNPGRSVLMAAAGGYLFNRLPIASLLAVGVKLVGACVPPALITLGICRVAGYCRVNARAVQTIIATDDDTNRVLATDA